MNTARNLSTLHVRNLGALGDRHFAANTLAFEALAPSGPWATGEGLPLPGQIHAGTYAAVAEALESRSTPPVALVLLFAHGSGMEAFLDRLRPLLRGVPCAGGAAARAELAGGGFVAPPAADVVALAIEAGRWEAATVRFHRPVGERIQVLAAGPRTFSEVIIDGSEQPALDAFASVFQRHGLSEAAWDRCALLDTSGRLIHLHADEGRVHCGTDLPADGRAEIAIFDACAGAADCARTIRSGVLVFGCAGLHGLLGPERPWAEGCSVAYLYGEVVTLDCGPAFANLSISVLQQTA